MVCSLPPWLGPPLPQCRCICTAVNSQGSPSSPIQSGSSITTNGRVSKRRALKIQKTGRMKTTGHEVLREITHNLKYRLNLLMWSKRFTARLQLRTGQYKQITRKAAWIPAGCHIYLCARYCRRWKVCGQAGCSPEGSRGSEQGHI